MDINSLKIEDLGITANSVTALRRVGITTIEKLMKCSEEYLLSIRNLGPKRVDEIMKKIRECSAMVMTMDGETVPSVSAQGSPISEMRSQKDVREIRLQDTGLVLSARAKKELKRFHIQTIGELIDLIEKDLFILDYFDPETIAELLDGIAALKRRYSIDASNGAAEDRESSLFAEKKTEPPVNSHPGTDVVGDKTTKTPGKNTKKQKRAESVPEKEYTSDFILSCVRRDTLGFEQFVENNGICYDLTEAYRFIRGLYMNEVSSFLKMKHGVSYAEYLIVNGLIPARPLDYWEEALLSYLNNNYTQCENGMLYFSRPSFSYDLIRKVCVISAPLYDGYDRVTCFQIADKISGELLIQPHFCDQNYSCDVVLLSNNKAVGSLNQILFRSKGLGFYLAPLLYLGIVTTKPVRISDDEYPNTIIELKLP